MYVKYYLIEILCLKGFHLIFPLFSNKIVEKTALKSQKKLKIKKKSMTSYNRYHTTYHAYIYSVYIHIYIYSQSGLFVVRNYKKESSKVNRNILTAVVLVSKNVAEYDY